MIMEIEASDSGVKPLEGDAGRESLLSYFSIKSPENLCCGGGKKIRKMCINPFCQTQALVCT
jgi:hypothetical protein